MKKNLIAKNYFALFSVFLLCCLHKGYGFKETAWRPPRDVGVKSNYPNWERLVNVPLFCFVFCKSKIYFNENTQLGKLSGAGRSCYLAQDAGNVLSLI